MRKVFADLRDHYATQIRAWCEEEGRATAPLYFFAAVGLVTFLRILFHLEFWTPWGTFIFLIHELGHIVFGIFGRFIGVAGGSLFQLLVPLFYIGQFFYKRDYPAALFCLVWLAESFYNVSFYVADARAQLLPLVSPFSRGGPIIHDWHYLLSATGLLNFDVFLGALMRLTGLACVAFFFAGTYWIWRRINRLP